MSIAFKDVWVILSQTFVMEKAFPRIKLLCSCCNFMSSNKKILWQKFYIQWFSIFEFTIAFWLMSTNFYISLPFIPYFFCMQLQTAYGTERLFSLVLCCFCFLFFLLTSDVDAKKGWDRKLLWFVIKSSDIRADVN